MTYTYYINLVDEIIGRQKYLVTSNELSGVVLS